MQEIDATPTPGPPEITELLRRIETGDAEARDALFVAVYDRLRGMARRQMAGEQSGQTLQPTALVHEVYLQLLAAAGSLENRRHFFAVAAEAMRRVFVWRARRHGRAKRGGGLKRVDLDAASPGVDPRSDDLLALDEALGRLERRDPAMAEVVKLRFYAGLTVPETAAALGVSTRSVDRAWSAARAWIHRQLMATAAEPPL